ncbi:MAG: leucine-rich repeat domain-containing protein, partial [Clostridia bacterium]|nr:leucine-rich repeat domain-containing protein [Clostridia bacterium]
MKNTYKKFIALVLCALLTGGLFNLSYISPNANASLLTGDKPTAMLGVYQYVSGDYVYQADHEQNYAWHPDTIVIVKYTGNKRSITVPTQIDGYRVGRIGVKAFSSETNSEMEELRSVIIPSGIYAIGVSAFSGCSNLCRVKLNEGLETIDRSAFRNCYNLKDITLPSTLINLCTDFTGTGIREVTVPESRNEFYDRLSVAVDDFSVFSSHSNNLEKLTVYKNNCAIHMNMLPSSEAVFEGTVYVEPMAYALSPTIPNLPDRMVFRKGVPSVMLPYLSDAKKHYDVENGGVWYDNTEKAEPVVSGDYSYLLNSSGRAIITGYSGSGTQVNIPASIDGHRVIRIADCVFMNNTEIESVSVPYTVISIESEAFYGCTSLSSVSLEEGLISIGSYSFYKCSSLSEIEIPDTVEDIDEYAFSLSGLVSVTVPENVTQLKWGAFR